MDDFLKGMPKSISIKVTFGENLQKFTKNPGHPVVMSEGVNFGFLLQSVFMEYPEIKEKCKPRELEFTINGYSPKIHSPLFDGDEVYFESVNK
ncbi:hypothetical protein IT400_01800 [Candidatus Nomurabacteria bacterium]|nr:hypothetical protein [Candidatus Nomurabacteria bacterium]